MCCRLLFLVACCVFVFVFLLSLLVIVVCPSLKMSYGVVVRCCLLFDDLGAGVS